MIFGAVKYSPRKRAILLKKNKFSRFHLCWMLGGDSFFKSIYINMINKLYFTNPENCVLNKPGYF